MFKYALAVLAAVVLAYGATQLLGAWPDSWSQYLIAAVAALITAWISDRADWKGLIAAGILLVVGYGAHTAGVTSFVGFGFFGLGILAALGVLVFFRKPRTATQLRGAPHGHR